MKKIISLLLCLAMLAGLLTGCSAAGEPIPYTPVGDELVADAQGDVAAAEEGENEFMMAFYPDTTMNPLSCPEFTNRVIISLMYQGLFATSRDGEVLPILCKNYTASADLMIYEFFLDPTATFSDGARVTPEDVAASLKESRNHRYFGRRLNNVNAIEATEDWSVRIYLAYPNGNLPLLLDIPIIKATELEMDYPLGTGPYTLTGWGSNRSLLRRENWWCESEDLVVNFDKIPLIAADSAPTVRDAFEFFGADLVCADPCSDLYAEFRCDYELWDCDNGMFVYLAINDESPVFQSAEVRRAISRGINRELLADQYYRGFGQAAALPASPSSPFYTAPLAKQYDYDPEVYQAAMSSVKGSSIKLLVNSSDSLRLRVAQEIGRMLNTSGLLVEVDARAEGYYEGALSRGEYDMYLGQTKLSPNMDLSPFFAEDGPLNYGGLDNVGIYTMCLQAVENQGEYYALHQAVMDDAYLCPIVFRSYAVYMTRGVLEELRPARDNVFCYSIGRSLTDAYIVQGA